MDLDTNIQSLPNVSVLDQVVSSHTLYDLIDKNEWNFFEAVYSLECDCYQSLMCNNRFHQLVSCSLNIKGFIRNFNYNLKKYGASSVITNKNGNLILVC